MNQEEVVPKPSQLLRFKRKCQWCGKSGIRKDFHVAGSSGMLVACGKAGPVLVTRTDTALGPVAAVWQRSGTVGQYVASQCYGA